MWVTTNPEHENLTLGWTLPCLQKPLSYQGQSLILDSGSMCRKGHSLLLHSPESQHTV